MKILILGATGRTGRLLVNEGLRRGHAVNVLIRDKSKLSNSIGTLSVYEGTPANINDLEKSIQGCEAILSSLNISRTSDFPLAKLRTPKNFITASIKNLIILAGQLKTDRVITISAWGASETRAELPFWFRWMIDYSNVKYGYLEHESQEKLLKNSKLNWTVVRPVILTNSKKDRDVKVSFNSSPKPNLFISRQNVAKFMFDALEKGLYVKQSPTIS